MPNELTPAEQQERYRSAKAEHDAAMKAWRDGGEQGPPPPRPVPPHTPGWIWRPTPEAP